MKKRVRLVILIMVLSFFMNGCIVIDNSRDNNNSNNETDSGGQNMTDDSADTFTFKAEVIESKDALLVAPDPESNEYKSSDKISVNAANSTITDRKGKNITGKELKAGDIIHITYNGLIMESYPAQIVSDSIKVTDHNNLIDGYLAMIDDIYKEDTGLNSNLKMIALDTTKWVGVTKTEKEIIFDKMKEIYGVDIIEGTYDELSEKGLINKEKLIFPDGILITISKIKCKNDNKEITYSISKWKSGLGAVGADQVKARYKGTGWKITKKSTWVS